LDRHDDLCVDMEIEAEDRVLRVVRQLCYEYEAPDLWQRIACRVLDVDVLNQQDDQRYAPPVVVA
jgi:hypothetical protein